MGAKVINNTSTPITLNISGYSEELASREDYTFSNRCYLTAKSGTSLTFNLNGQEVPRL